MPLLVVAVTPSLERPLLVLPAVVVIVYLAPIKLTAGVPAVNWAPYTIAGSVYTYASASAKPSGATLAVQTLEYVGVPSVAV